MRGLTTIVRRLWLSFGLVGMVASACAADSDADDPNATSPSTCSSAPAQYSIENQPPYDPNGLKTDPSGLPSCAPRCRTTIVPGQGVNAGLPYEALPSGSCRGHARCFVGITGSTQTCGTDTHLCNN